MAWEVRIFYGTGEGPPVEVTAVQFGDERPTDLDWTPPENPGWGSRGGVYHYVWFSGVLLEVPGVVGRNRQFAEALLQDLDVVINRVNPPQGEDWTPDRIMTQDVPSGTLVTQGSTITLDVAR